PGRNRPAVYGRADLRRNRPAPGCADEHGRDPAAPGEEAAAATVERDTGMTCEQIEVWISAYQDGELDPGRRRRVEDHLATCCPCRELVAEWTALERSLRAEMTRCDAPETLHARVMR